LIDNRLTIGLNAGIDDAERDCGASRFNITARAIPGAGCSPLPVPLPLLAPLRGVDEPSDGGGGGGPRREPTTISLPPNLRELGVDTDGGGIGNVPLCDEACLAGGGGIKRPPGNTRGVVLPLALAFAIAVALFGVTPPFRGGGGGIGRPLAVNGRLPVTFGVPGVDGVAGADDDANDDD
jgi:hypothetical protein